MKTALRIGLFLTVLSGCYQPPPPPPADLAFEAGYVSAYSPSGSLLLERVSVKNTSRSLYTNATARLTVLFEDRRELVWYYSIGNVEPRQRWSSRFDPTPAGVVGFSLALLTDQGSGEKVFDTADLTDQ